MTAVANEERGEISIELEGVPHVLRPDYTAQIAIERATGHTIQHLAQICGSTGLKIEQAAVVVTECVKAQGRAIGDSALQAFTATSVGECLVDTGMLQVGARLELLLYLAATGGYTAQGNPKARAVPTTGSTLSAA